MLKEVNQILLIIFCVLIISPVFSQDIFSAKDLSSIRVDQLSDADLLQYQNQLASSGLSQDQVEQMAISRGFPMAELIKLRARMVLLGNKKTAEKPSPQLEAIRGSGKTTDMPTSLPSQKDIRLFGSELFNNSSLSFQPDLKIATPLNYVLGPDDELLINVYGLQEVSFNLNISPEGAIYIQNIGMIKVAGFTVEAATALIRNKMASIAYRSLRTGASKLSVSLGKIRSIRITILGAEKSGTYTISSLSTLFNALYVAGGPSANGTFRSVELIRNNKLERVVDLYNFLTNADQSDNVRLQDNDVIRIPVYNNRVEIIGEVKREGIYEILDNETFNDLIRFANGFTNKSYKASVEVTQLTDKDKKVKDLLAHEFDTYRPKSGDIFAIRKILDRYQNRVTISGAIFRPGNYELNKGLTVGQLISKADGLTEDAYLKRGQLIRVKDDLTTELISFDVKGEINNKTGIELRREDKVVISSIFDLKDNYNITIQGEIRKPGEYNYIERLTLKDLILQAGGLADGAYPQRIEVARRISRDTLTKEDTRLSEIIEIKDDNDFAASSNNIGLKPFDIITIRRKPGYLDVKSVSVIGEAQFTGPYVLENRSEKISDIITRAGGLTPEAYPEGAYLRRQNIELEFSKKRIEKIQLEIKDSTSKIKESVARTYDQIPINLDYILKNPGSAEDLLLKSDDLIYIPTYESQIKTSGAILFPTQIIFNSNYTLKDYVLESGGFSKSADKKKVYVLYPNGKVMATKKFLLFRNYPNVKPGSEIIIPQKPERIRVHNTAEVVAMSSIFASLAGIIIALVRF